MFRRAAVTSERVRDSPPAGVYFLSLCTSLIHTVPPSLAASPRLSQLLQCCWMPVESGFSLQSNDPKIPLSCKKKHFKGSGLDRSASNHNYNE